MTIGQERSIYLELEDAARALGHADRAMERECNARAFRDCRRCGHRSDAGGCELLTSWEAAFENLREVCRRMTEAGRVLVKA